jgi:hypothetical protein
MRQSLPHLERVSPFAALGAGVFGAIDPGAAEGPSSGRRLWFQAEKRSNGLPVM